MTMSYKWHASKNKNEGFSAAAETLKKTRRRTQADSRHDQVLGKAPGMDPEGLDGGQEEGAEVLTRTSSVKNVARHAGNIIREE